MANTKVTSAVIADGAITPSKIASGDFYFDNDTLYIDSTNNRVGIGQSSPQAYLHVYGTNAEQLRLEGNDEYTYLRFQGTPSGGSSSALGDLGFGNYSGTAIDLNIANCQNGSLTFHTGSSFTQRMTITNDGTMGFGMSPLGANNGSAFFDGNVSSKDGFMTTASDLTLIQPSAGNTIFVRDNGNESMRINAGGSILFGKTSASASATGIHINGNGVQISVVNFTSAGTAKVFNNNNATGSTYKIEYRQNNSAVGNISVGSSSTSYNTTSDYRLKENVDYAFNALERVTQLKPARFNFISEADKTFDGFLAHEVQEIVPEAITGVKDEMQEEEYEVTPAVLDEEGNVVTEAVMGTREVPKYQGIDQSKLVPLLTKAIQEQQTIIDDLKARIETLENA